MSKFSMKQLLDFQRFLNDFRDIERVISYQDDEGNERYEDDAQHSFHTAMLAWYLGRDMDDLDLNRVIKMCLAHDLVEVYAGDEMALGRTDKQEEAKKKRERDAMIQIEKRFPDFRELHQLIEEYEERETTEARFAYDVDKLAPMIHNVSVRNPIWKKLDLDREFVISEKAKKIKKDSRLYQLWKQLEQHLHENDNLFNPPKT